MCSAQTLTSCIFAHYNSSNNFNLLKSEKKCTFYVMLHYGGNFLTVLKVMWFPFLWFPGGRPCLNVFPVSMQWLVFRKKQRGYTKRLPSFLHSFSNHCSVLCI